MPPAKSALRKFARDKSAFSAENVPESLAEQLNDSTRDVVLQPVFDGSDDLVYKLPIS